VFLFVPDEAAAQRAFAALSAEGVERVTLAWSEDGTAPFALDRALAGTCVRVGPPHDAPLRALRLAGARCTASERR
jgi:hypothetical protein